MSKPQGVALAVAEGVAPPNQYRNYALPIRIVATKPNAAKLKYALDETPSIVSHLENYFGQAFPFPKLDQVASPIMPGASRPCCEVMCCWAITSSSMP